MKYIRKRRFLLTVLCCLMWCGMSLTAAASAAVGLETEAETSTQEVPRAVFENESNNAQDLYVTKQVELVSGTEDALDPDLRFSFILKLNQKLAEKQVYRVFNQAGEEVFQSKETDGITETTDKDAVTTKVPYMTDRSGMFTLKPGQTARFENVGAGTSYEVTEVPQDGWTQTTPAGGAAASGTVTDKGAVAAFVNTNGDVGNGQIMVRKTISFPSGYKAPQDTDFYFVLQVDGKAWNQENYTITDTETGLEAGTGVTGADGKFSIKGGQTATFTGIPENVDYSVEEVEVPGGWHNTGADKQEGTTGTSGSVLASFNNASASFAVSKRMEDNSKPDVDFTFLLTKEDRTVWAGASYWLYLTDGTPVMDGDKVTTKQTDGNGNFTLKPGQTAIFYGIEPGTVYSVSEKGESSYVQIVPSTQEGYTDKIVSDTVEVLPFVNRLSDGGLTVTKVLDLTEGQAPQEQQEFTFILKKLDVADNTFKPVVGTVYSIETGMSETTWKTNEAGEFTLKPNETARFARLGNGTYQVEEKATDPQYSPDKAIQEAVISNDQKNIGLTFTNTYHSRAFDLYILKKNYSEKALSGAEFMLYRDEALNNSVPEAPYVSDKDGKISIKELQTGTYYLVETKSPLGYQLLASPIVIDVTWRDNAMQVTVDGNTVTETDADKQIYIVKQDKDHVRDEVHVTVYNSSSFALPLTGGAGSMTVILGAGIVLLLAAFWYITRKSSKKGNV